jgi:superfamily II DNA/RNA helicase
MTDFRSGKARLVCATDVASRGLDIGDITHVINYDFPNEFTNYIHRIGRTGRAGESGIAITFIVAGNEDGKTLWKLIDFLKRAK